MSTLPTEEGTQIPVEERGSGRPVVSSHGRPLDADARDARVQPARGEGL